MQRLDIILLIRNFCTIMRIGKLADQANLNYLSFLYAIRICLILDTRSTLNLIFLTSSYKFAIKVQVVCNPKEDPYIVFIECPIKN